MASAALLPETPDVTVGLGYAHQLPALRLQMTYSASEKEFLYQERSWLEKCILFIN
jgi:hypothetical protein